MSTVKEILAELRSKPTTSVPNAGKVLGDLSKNAAYDAARAGTLGVPTSGLGESCVFPLSPYCSASAWPTSPNKPPNNDCAVSDSGRRFF